MKKFRIRSTVNIEIKEIEIEKETAQFVFLPAYGREAKLTNYGGFFNTYEEAKAWYIIKFTKEIDSLQNQLDYVKSKLDKANAL